MTVWGWLFKWFGWAFAIAWFTAEGLPGPARAVMGLIVLGLWLTYWLRAINTMQVNRSYEDRLNAELVADHVRTQLYAHPEWQTTSPNPSVPPGRAQAAPTVAGWYADPRNPRQWRYYDGRGWTTHVSDPSATSPTPPS